MKFHAWIATACLAACSFACLAQDPSSAGGGDMGATSSSSDSASASTTQTGGGNGGPTLDIPVTTDPHLLYPTSSDQILQPGDQVTIFIYAEGAFSPAQRINGAGNVDLPYLHLVHLAGLSIAQSEKLLAGLLIQAGIFVDPQIVVTVTESLSSYATFVGEMRSRVPIYGSRRLIDVLSAVGGFPSTASHTILISRKGVDAPIVVDLGPTPILSPAGQTIILPGDVLSIQKYGVVYVLGKFSTDGVYPLSGNEPTTIMQLSAKLGEPQFAAKPHDLRLIRTTNGQRHFVTIDYKAIVEGKAPDPILRGGDILYMPTNAFKAAITSGGLSAGLNLVNLALLAYQVSHYQ